MDPTICNSYDESVDDVLDTVTIDSDSYEETQYDHDSQPSGSAQSMNNVKKQQSGVVKRFVIGDIIKIVDHCVVDNVMTYKLAYSTNTGIHETWIPETNMNDPGLITSYWSSRILPVTTSHEGKDERVDYIDVDDIDPFEDHSMTPSTQMQVDEDENYEEVEEDEIAEIENIMSDCMHEGKRMYQIKWVGSKKVTWIEEDDFIQKDLLKEYHTYERNRKNKSLKRRAYIYCRTSKRNSDNEVSLFDQEQRCLDYAKRKDITVIGVFRDNGVSAKNMKEQFALNHIFKQLERGECILFYDVSRFSRSIVQAIEKLEHIRLNLGCVAHSVHEGVTWNNVSTNRAIFRQHLSNSQMHSEIVSEKVKNSIEFRKKRGDHLGRIPYGYSRIMVKNARRLVENPEEIKVIRKLFNKAVDVLAERLDEMSVIEKNSKSKSKKVAVKTHRYDRIFGSLENKDYRDITNSINKMYTFRGKAFTWTMVRKIMTIWANKMSRI